MNLRKVLSVDTIALDLKSDTKDGIIEEMIDLLMAAGKIRDLKDKKEALRVVLERERKMSTGMQNGIAIPHGKTDRVDNLVAAVALKKSGVDFGSLDGQTLVHTFNSWRRSAGSSTIPRCATGYSRPSGRRMCSIFYPLDVRASWAQDALRQGTFPMNHE